MEQKNLGQKRTHFTEQGLMAKLIVWAKIKAHFVSFKVLIRPCQTKIIFNKLLIFLFLSNLWAFSNFVK